MKSLSLFFLFFPFYGLFSQQYLLKFNPITAFPSDLPITLHTYCGYEHRFSYRSTVELGASASLGSTFLTNDAGSFNIVSTNIKYRNYFYLKDSQIRKGIYVGWLIRYQHKTGDCGAWCIGERKSQILGIGNIIGKNVALKRRGFIDLHLGAVISYFQESGFTAQIDDIGQIGPSIYHSNAYFAPQFYAAFHWGIVLDRKK